LTNLRALILGGLREPEAWLEAVSTLHNLEELYLGFNESPTDKSLDRLRNLTNLPYLGLTGIQNLTDSAMEPIGTLTQLKELTLWRTGHEFSGSGLHYLRDVPLRSVAFSFCKWLTDEVFEALGGCSSLDTLDLWECPNLTGAGLADLVVVSRLSKLTLRSCEGIRNANLRGLIDVIHSFTLTLDRCPQITQANIEELREANPRLAINFNR
jgi:F-box and leucine-rich repeat protein 14